MKRALVLNSHKIGTDFTRQLALAINNLPDEVTRSYEVVTATEVWGAHAAEFGGFKGWQDFTLGKDAFGAPRFAAFVLLDERAMGAPEGFNAIVQVSGAEALLPKVTGDIVCKAAEKGLCIFTHEGRRLEGQPEVEIMNFDIPDAKPFKNGNMPKHTCYGLRFPTATTI